MDKAKKVHIVNHNKPIDIYNPPSTIAAFTHHDQTPIKDVICYRQAITGNWENTSFAKIFFSKKNINKLQQEIIKGVYRKSNGQYNIGNQSEDELKVIMHTMYLQHSNKLPNNVNEQITKLNKYVLDYSIDRVYKETIAYINYKRDASTLAIPMQLPESTRDTKQLEYYNRGL